MSHEYDAIRDAVRDAFDEVNVYKAIKEGVEAAILRIATNATDMPCEDFYKAIKKGVKESCSHLGHDIITS